MQHRAAAVLPVLQFLEGPTQLLLPEEMSQTARPMTAAVPNSSTRISGRTIKAMAFMPRSYVGGPERAEANQSTSRHPSSGCSAASINWRSVSSRFVKAAERRLSSVCSISFAKLLEKNSCTSSPRPLNRDHRPDQDEQRSEGCRDVKWILLCRQSADQLLRIVAHCRFSLCMWSAACSHDQHSAGSIGRPTA